MADKTINQFTEDTGPTPDDFVLVWDVGTGASKKVTILNLLLKILNASSTSWAWGSWTPTLSGRLDDADWTKACKFVQFGKTVIFRLSLTATAAAPMGGGSAGAIFTFPTASVSMGTSNRSVIATGMAVDDSGSSYPISVFWVTTTTGNMLTHAVSGANVVMANVTSTAPFTWTNPDVIFVQGFYEVP